MGISAISLLFRQAVSLLRMFAEFATVRKEIFFCWQPRLLKIGSKMQDTQDMSAHMTQTKWMAG